MGSDKKSDKQIEMDKSQAIMNLIAWRCAYYRANPSRFIEDFIPGLKLKVFQKILLWAMANNNMAYLVASRGIGKTYVMAMYGVYKCVLFPKTKYVCCSCTQKQGREILLKITEDFMHKSNLLCNEILNVKIGQNDNIIFFKNGSFMKVVVAGETARGTRSTVLATDESRMVSQKIVDSVLRPMNSSPRERPYVNKPEYAHMFNDEVPQEFYLSSAWYCMSEMYDKVKSYTANMLDPKLNYFVCSLPYQLCIKEGILLRETIENEISEATFNEISFKMERESLFQGTSEDSLYDFNTLSKQRILEDSLHDLDYYRMNNLRIPEKQRGEVRVLSVDVALMASRKHDNDASALIIHSAIPTSSHNYIDNIVYIDTQEGLVTEELGLLVMRYFYQYDCDYLVIDSNGIGLGILDYIMADRYDPVFGQSYGALDCYNDPEMSERCKVKGAPKVVWSIKANSRMNNDMALSLRAGFQNGYINLLIDDNNVVEKLSKIRGYKGLSDTQKDRLVIPYIQTTLLINELINLDHEVSNGLIKLKEKRGMRKDRFSSLEYGYYVVQELSKKLKPKSTEQEIIDILTTRPAKKVGSF